MGYRLKKSVKDKIKVFFFALVLIIMVVGLALSVNYAMTINKTTSSLKKSTLKDDVIETVKKDKVDEIKEKEEDIINNEVNNDINNQDIEEDITNNNDNELEDDNGVGKQPIVPEEIIEPVEPEAPEEPDVPEEPEIPILPDDSMLYVNCSYPMVMGDLPVNVKVESSFDANDKLLRNVTITMIFDLSVYSFTDEQLIMFENNLLDGITPEAGMNMTSKRDGMTFYIIKSGTYDSLMAEQPEEFTITGDYYYDNFKASLISNGAVCQ